MANVLILGGCGFIGRNVVAHLVNEGNCGKIRVVDKVHPSMAYFTADVEAAFANEVVEYMQGNLSSEAGVKKSFELEGAKWDQVYDLGGEARFGQNEMVYEQKTLRPAVLCGKQAVANGVGRYVFMSDARVYDAGKSPSDESGSLKPWTGVATAKLAAEEELKKLGLDLVILRPAVVYGVGDILGITPRLIIGAVYKHTKETMKLLWTAKLAINTVHVVDVCRALWHVGTVDGVVGQTFNLADSNETNQGHLNAALETIFGIKTGFQGSIKSKLAAVALKSTAEFVNEEHMGPWNEMIKAAGGMNTPLTPFLDMELLRNNPLSIDGTAIAATGFQYTVDGPTVENLTEVVDAYRALNIFPADA